MRRTKLASLALAAALALMLGGCGSNRDSGGDQTAGGPSFGTDPATGIAFVGAGACVNCHQDFSWSSALVTRYLDGPHVIHSTSISQENAAEGCLECHDPIGDGPTLEGLIDPADVPAGGLAAVGCENCHGAGGQHWGTGPIPDANPDYNACGQCHNSEFFHNAFDPEADNIVEDYQTSRHFEGRVRNSNICVKCHSDEGARQYKDIHDSTRLFSSALPVETANVVQCRTCHDAHNPEELLLPEVTQRNVGVVASTEYATCTNCHQAHDAEVGASVDYPPGTTVSATSDGASDTAGGGELIYHAARFERIITVNHYDDPATPALIEGFVMDPKNERVCRDCHNVHSADLTINEQWAESAHAGHIAEAKDAAAETAAEETIAQTIAVKAAAVIDDADTGGPAWVHYDWDAGNRQPCQRCHTSTGLMNFLADTANYDQTANNFSHLVGWSKAADGTVTSSGQNEMLFCWGCHSDNAGTLRNPGNITLDFGYLEGPEQNPGGTPVTVVLPDKGDANVCAACHSGRGNDTSVRSNYADALANNDAPGHTLSFRFAGHHAPTAGSLYAEVTHTGFEFAGQNYAPVPFFEHDDIETNGDSPETGEGPCVGCHMAGSANHTFEAVEEDDLGNITAIKNQALCDSCHSGAFVMNPAILEEEKAGFEDARSILSNYVTNTTPNYLNLLIYDGVTNNLKTSLLSLNDYGAYQNSAYMTDEPCIYVHNRFYGKRLIFDSIDWLDNGVLDGTITVDETVNPAAAEWLGADPATNIATRP